MKRLTQLAQALDLPLDNQDLARLRPMVDDLMDEARRLRRYQPGNMGRADDGGGPASRG